MPSKTEGIRYRDLLVEHNYLRNTCANLIGRFGDSIDALAFAWMVYEITGDRSWSAIVFGLNALPTILLMPLAGVLVERYDKRRVMVLADLGRALLVALIATLYMTGLVTAPMLAASTFLMSTFEAFRIPAGLALYPKIVPREKYTVATSLTKSLGSIMSILGNAAFGVIVVLWGLQGAMYINAATFLISAAFVFSIRLPREKVAQVALNLKHFTQELKVGFQYMYGRRVVFMICMVGSVIGVLNLPMNSLSAPYVQESLGQGELAISVISVSCTVGMMLGTFIFPWLNRRVSKSNLFLIGGISMVLAYAGYVAVSWIPQVALLYVALAAVSAAFGVGGSFISMVVNVSFMEQIEPGYLSRVGSIFNAMASALIPLASFAVAGIATVLTVNQVFVMFSVLTALLFGGLALSRLFRTIDLPVG